MRAKRRAVELVAIANVPVHTQKVSISVEAGELFRTDLITLLLSFTPIYSLYFSQ